jgi:adenine deaminase
MATINTAEHFGLTAEVGMIAPGRWADILLVSSLPDLQIDQVIARGRLAAENGRILVSLPKFSYPDWATNSIHLARPLTSDDFRLKAPEQLDGRQQVTANVIGVIENQAPTRHLRQEVSIEAGEARVEMKSGLAKVALVERHAATGGVQVGLVHGFGFNVPCAIASTVAHDCHHMLVVGTDEADMAQAANELARIGGGQIVVRQGKVIGQVNLPIAGLISNERAELVARKAASVLYGFRACGCTLNNPNMQLSLLALAVIPELRISDQGLVDVTRFGHIPVLEA